eukprot:1487634-Amphidinium_carterae.1
MCIRDRPEHVIVKSLCPSRSVSHSADSRTHTDELGGAIATSLALEGGIAFYATRFGIEATIAESLSRDISHNALLNASMSEFFGADLEAWTNSDVGIETSRAMEGLIRRSDALTVLEFLNGPYNENDRKAIRAQLMDRPLIQTTKIKAEEPVSASIQKRPMMQELIRKRYGDGQKTPMPVLTVPNQPIAIEGMSTDPAVPKTQAHTDRQETPGQTFGQAQVRRQKRKTSAGDQEQPAKKGKGGKSRKTRGSEGDDGGEEPD